MPSSSSASGQATPPSDPASSPVVEDYQHRYHHQREPLRVPAGDEDDDGDSDIYELKELQDGGREDGSYADYNVENGAHDDTERRGVMKGRFYTADEERTVVRKFDRKLVLFLAFCYMLSFVDRSNIGNARIAGMEDDLQTQPPHDNYFEWALRAFYIAYITFEWMSLLWRIVPAHIYVSLVILSWGITASLQAVVTSYPMLIVLRGLLGIGEAGFTGVPFYLSFFFKRRELAFRTALFISAAPLASALAGGLAWLILFAGKILPIASWRLLFLVEGFPSVIVSTIAWGIIPDTPESTSYLTPRECKIARLRLQEEKSQSGPGSSKKNSASKIKYKEVLAAFIDPKAWLTAFMFFFTNMAYSTLPTFLPTILEEMGHGKLAAEALSTPPNLLAFGVVLATAHISDRAQARSAFIIGLALLSASGYLVLALARPLGIGPLLRYIAVYPAAVGFFSVVVLIIAWSVNNQPSEGQRGGGFALLQVVGQCGPLLGAQLYPNRDAPYFEPGMWSCAAGMLGVAVLALILRLYLIVLNRRLNREEGEEDEAARGLVASTSRKQRGFRYMI
ncbi:major facilitator superfamily domain-containing protein [Xylariaceae sp. FL0255]|nr:major facilitator superfamily domain-containing protein [Xylariaceae sp. FL0255]